MNTETPQPAAPESTTPSKIDALLGSIEGGADRQLAARLLQIDSDGEYAGLIESVLPELLDGPCRVERVDELNDAHALLGQSTYDAILVSSRVCDDDPTSEIRELLRTAAGTPVIVLVDDDAMVSRAMSAGAGDVLLRPHDDPNLLARSIQTAITRRKPGQSRFRPAADGEDGRQAQIVDLMNTREAKRFPLNLPAILIPILPDGRPNASAVVEGTTLDISTSGIGVRIGGAKQLSRHLFVLGVGNSLLDLSFATCRLAHRRATPEGIELGAGFLDGEANPFHPEKLKPIFDPGTCTYRTAINDVAAMGWLAVGVLRPELFDYVSVCPECTAVVSFRKGCAECGSARTGLSRLIHHLACAHVALAEDFDNGEQLTCPKCRQQKLVVGADFEYFDGPYRCFDCEWSDVELEPIAQCLRCGLRCPGAQTVRKELIYYHVNRLDPLAFLH